MANSDIVRPGIAKLVANINEAANALEDTIGHDLHLPRQRLQLETRKLLDLLQEPNNEVWPRIFQVNVSAAVEVLSRLRLWEQFDDGRSLSLAEIVDLTKAHESVIIRIFRQLTAANIFVESPGPRFLLTSLGKPYLNPIHRAFNNFVFFDILPSIMAMPQKLAEHGFDAPNSKIGTPYQWVHGTEFWTAIGSCPDRARQMATGTQSHTPANAYPWELELGNLELDETDVAIVDVAGGQGHTMREIRKRNPGITGRIVVQDLASTLDTLLNDSSETIEHMVYDIFTPQPVKNASVYHYRHVCHNWSDDDCTKFLSQVVPLLKLQPKSRLLLVDLVLPDIDATMQEAIMDMTMFPMGGMERTESQWKYLLARSGLSIKKIWRGSEPEACIECQLLSESDAASRCPARSTKHVNAL